jgi:hypothetical protein
MESMPDPWSLLSVVCGAWSLLVLAILACPPSPVFPGAGPARFWFPQNGPLIGPAFMAVV